MIPLSTNNPLKAHQKDTSTLRALIPLSTNNPLKGQRPYKDSDEWVWQISLLKSVTSISLTIELSSQLIDVSYLIHLLPFIILGRAAGLIYCFICIYTSLVTYYTIFFTIFVNRYPFHGLKVHFIQYLPLIFFVNEYSSQGESTAFPFESSLDTPVNE